MSKTALLFLFASLASFTGAMLLPLGESATSAVLGAAAASFAVLFVLALVKGRRIKFDPLLR